LNKPLPACPEEKKIPLKSWHYIRFANIVYGIAASWNATKKSFPNYFTGIIKYHHAFFN